MMRYVSAHEPALLPQEAAMLTALPETAAVRRTNLLMPQDTSHFVSVDAPAEPAAQTRRGSVAGRAVLSAAGISLPGVQGMSRGCRRYQDRQRACAHTRYAMEWL